MGHYVEVLRVPSPLAKAARDKSGTLRMTPRLLLQPVRRASLAEKFLFTVFLWPGLARIFDWYRRAHGCGGLPFASSDRRALLSRRSSGGNEIRARLLVLCRGEWAFGRRDYFR